MLVPALTDAGLCVYGADYGNRGLGSVRESALQLITVVDAVTAATGATQVDVVGYSQGGLVLRTAMRLDGLADRIGTAALISPSFHGTTSPLIGMLPAGACPACADQAADSALVQELAGRGGDLDGTARYAVAVSSADQIVTPWESQIPVGPDNRVRSVVVEQQCAGTRIQHQDMSRDRGVVGWIAAALIDDGDVTAADLVCTPGTG